MKVKVFNATEEQALNDFIEEHNLTTRHLNISDGTIICVYDADPTDKDKQIRYLKKQLNKFVADRLNDEINLRNFRSLIIQGRGSDEIRDGHKQNALHAEKNIEQQDLMIRSIREAIKAIDSGELVI